MKSALALFLVTGAPAAANPQLLDFMGGQGCTFGTESHAAAVASGFSETEIDGLVDQSLAEGTARREGDYVVLSESVCNIRVPDLSSPYSASSPEIMATTSGRDVFAADGFPGCFLNDPIGAFDVLRGKGQRSGFLDYVGFVGAGIAAGELSFYGTSPLSVPPGFMVVQGPCAEDPRIDDIRRSQLMLRALFGPMIREMGEENTCGPEAKPTATIEQMDSLIRLQGGDPESVENVGDGVNAWMWMEIFMLTAAAGWHEGMSATDMGTPRPPLCHYD